MAFPCKTPHKNNKNTQTERITTNVCLRMCICYVKILEIEYFVLSTKFEKYELY